jgi:AcrR family transcriptional regulator
MAAVANKQRRAESRNRLLDAASELFTELGYDDTTLESVADRAGLHVQTLYRHFPCKADLAAEIWGRSLSNFETFFTARKATAIAAWREWIEMNARQAPNTVNSLAGWGAWPTSHSAFVYWDRYQELLAEGLAEDMNVDVATDLRPMLVACMLWGGNQKIARSSVNKRLDMERLVALLLEVVDNVEVFIQSFQLDENS